MIRLSSSRLRFSVCAAACSLLLGASVLGAAPFAPPDRQEVIRYAAASGERTWQKAGNPTPDMASRELFTYALALAEAKLHPERLETLFEVAAKMQDRDKSSRGYGNFRWSWSNDKVMDYNAVEFCMQGGTLLWLRHRDTMPAAARQRLREILEFAVEGCLRHKVRESYTNIALMNAENLILLGEGLDMPKVADEGYDRLGRIVLKTWESGICEYDSPTYYGVDLDCLLLIAAFCRRDQGQRQARALLELFWTDIAANFFPPSERLGGPHSRDYDYTRGHGPLDTHLWMNGWIGGDKRGGAGAIFPALGRWQPPARLYEMSRSKFPRLVRQMWGTEANQSRTHFVLPDVTLGSSAANYHNMDLPLTVDLPGPPDFPRCYFIPDCRHDPYGKEKIREGSGPHSKTLHLRPFWTAAQQRRDALGLVLYRAEDMLKAATTLESHFVVPREADAFWVGDQQVELRPGTPATFPLKDGQSLVLRRGTAAVGVRVPWARGAGGRLPSAALVDDANKYGVVRLTVTHYEGAEPVPDVTGAGAALWVRVASGLNSDEAFAAWRREFASARCDVQAGADKLRFAAAGADGGLALEATFGPTPAATVHPPPARTVLELDGQDVGKALLADLEPVKSYRAAVENVPAVRLSEAEGTYIEAESGSMLAPMVVGADPAASGGKFTWMPGEPGGKGSGDGRILWDLAAAAAGRWYVWGRVLAPTPEDDSFFIDLPADGTAPARRLTWSLGTRTEWTWVPYAGEGGGRPAAVLLPQGRVRFEIRGREDGAKIDRLFITPKADDKPQ